MKFDIANQANLDAARVAFRAAFLAELGKVDDQPLEEMLIEVPSTTAVEEWEWLGDMPGMDEWEGDRILAEQKAFKMRVANKDWSSGLKLHQNQFKDDKLGLFSIVGMPGMAEAAKAHRVEFAAQLMINGFDGAQFPKTSNGLAYDGKFFFSTTRATGSNKSTTALDLTGAALDEGETLMESQTSYDGRRKLRLTGTHLIVGPKLRPTADRLMTSDFLANTAGTATISNPWKGRYQVVVEPWLAKGSAYENYWFLACANKAYKPLMFQLREEISCSAIIGGQGTSMDSVPRFQRGEIWMGAEARYNVAYFEPRLMVGGLVAQS